MKQPELIEIAIELIDFTERELTSSLTEKFFRIHHPGKFTREVKNKILLVALSLL